MNHLLTGQQEPRTYADAWNRIFNREITRLQSEDPNTEQWRHIDKARELAHRLTPNEYPNLTA